MSKNKRNVHFVGTYPADTAEQAMREMLDGIQDAPIVSLPDGETGEREDWIARIAANQQRNPVLEVLVPGDNSDYEHTWFYQIKEGKTLTPESLGLDYAEYVPDSYATFKKIAAEGKHADLRFQVGIPNAFDHALFIIKDGPMYLDVVTQAVADQINKIVEATDGEAVIQLESPAALTLAFRPEDQLPPFLHRKAVGDAMAQLVGKAPKGTRFGVHLCLGDLNNRTQFDAPLTSGKAVVAAAQAIVDAWPKDQSLEYIHFPIAGGDKPPLEDERLYDELGELGKVIPSHVRIIAGIAHESQDLDTQKRLLQLLEEKIGRNVDVAAACGIARRREDKVGRARTVVKRMHDLAVA